MPLTTRTNGTGGSNIITASWFNDFLDLFTGAMNDQPITFKCNVLMQAINSSLPAAPSLALASGTNLGIGVYKYAVTYLTSDGGESMPGSQASITTTTGNQAVNLSSIPTGPTGCVKRNIYRTKVNGSTFYLLTTINDNTTTTYSDTVADASLPSTTAPSYGSFGGSISFKNYAGTLTAQIFNSGAVWFDTGALYSDGSGNLYLASTIMKPGTQARGYVGATFNNVSTSGFVGVSQQYPNKCANTPTGITLTTKTSSNIGSGVQVNGIDQYGFNIYWNPGSTGQSYYTADYVTVGN